MVGDAQPTRQRAHELFTNDRNPSFDILYLLIDAMMNTQAITVTCDCPEERSHHVVRSDRIG